MNKALYRTLVIYVISFFIVPVIGQEDRLLSVLKDELKREFDTYSKQPIPCYYMEYRVEEIKSVQLECSLGSLVDDDCDSMRILSVTSRIGNYQLDNTHEVEKKGSIYNPFSLSLPLEDNESATRMILWKATQYAVRDAINTYNQVQTSLKETPKVPDFTKEPTNIYYEPPIPFKNIARDIWLQRLKKYTGRFVDNDNIIRADASLSYKSYRKYLVNSEGSSIVQNQTYAELQILLVGKSNEGSTPLLLSYHAFDPDSLPNDEQIESDLARIEALQNKLKDSPQAEAFAGPAILSPAAAAVFFHEIFGHRIEGQRLKYSFDSQTFKTQVGNRVLPKYINIYSDPTLKYFQGKAMFGYYAFDDQGVKAQRVNVVEDGVLKNFLMSRTPIEGFSQSNSHGRSQIGKMPVSRQSNLIVEARKTYSEKELRKKLIAECKKQKKSYGLYFKEVIGGFTQTSRYSPNVFNVTPTVVYKIYVDGRPDELVKGVDFIGTPLAIFSEIVAIGDEPGVFTGYCGAESGSIPVTATSPALLIKKIETQKKPEGFNPAPILGRPR
ncbi:MAG: TldD/PmbA family protein [Bacteroidales bacterium]|nr:TldD/PmbA family protein [Bacteroidales bacterium]HPO65671.1 TldD/PmbA family protein [Bacteroidales bacterium]